MGVVKADAQRLVTTRLLDCLHDPVGHIKSSAKGLSPRDGEITMRQPLRGFSGSRRQPAEVRGRSLFVSDYACGGKSSRSGMDSDLEAFSHNPADGSFAALPGRTAAKTNYLKPRFLSY